MSTIPFDEIVAGATARLAVIDGVQYLSIRDVIMHMCDLSSIRANEKWRLLPDEVKNEVAEFLGNFKFPGKGNKFEPVITFKGALKLVMLVSGQKATLYRSAMVSILQRYYAGDGSLLEEVGANSQSTAPIQQMVIACDEFSPGASARMVVIENVQYLSIRDLIQHWTGQDNKGASKIWDRLAESKKQEVSPDCRNFQFPGQGQSVQPVISFKGALKLVMMVTGDKAALYRASMVKILTRYYAGEGSLIDEVQANSQSTAPIQQMARASLVAEAVPLASEELSLPYKRRLAELEVAKVEAEVHATKIANRAAELANMSKERDSAREHLTKIKDSYREMCEDKVMDERARLILKDSFLNMAILHSGVGSTADGVGKGQKLLTNGKPISLSMVADQLGLKIPTNELISIGQELKKLYVEKNGRAPSKHEQLCGGRATMVNTYMEGDRPLLEEVLRRHVSMKT